MTSGCGLKIGRLLRSYSLCVGRWWNCGEGRRFGEYICMASNGGN